MSLWLQCNLMLWLSLSGSQVESMLDAGGRPDPVHNSGCLCRCCLDFVICKGPLYFIDQCSEERDPEGLWPQSQIQPSKIRFANNSLVLRLLSSVCFCSVLNEAWRQTESMLLYIVLWQATSCFDQITVWKIHGIKVLNGSLEGRMLWWGSRDFLKALWNSFLSFLQQWLDIL